jgi:alpha-galactosidase
MKIIAWAFGVVFGLVATSSFAESLYVSSLKVANIHPDMAKPQIDKSAGGNAISLGGKTYERGIGVQAGSRIIINLKGRATRFTATVGVDDEVKNAERGGTVAFLVQADGRRLFPPLPASAATRPRGGGGRGQLPTVRTTDAPRNIDLDVTGMNFLSLEVTPGNDGTTNDHASWADAKIEYSGEAPEVLPTDVAVILTPKAPPTPRINGARVFGVRPGRPFMFTVPATGNRPMTFAAEGLPDGLKIDPATGFITGKTTARGEHEVSLSATNSLGKAQSKLKIVVGDTIGLTPAMGWNSWNCFASAVDADKVKAAADSMVKSGLINHGWTYVNIDDFWEVYVHTNDRFRNDPTLQGDPRKPDGTINTNPRFPDMKGLTDYIHGLGLKAGIYSGPGPRTCGGCVASWQHEEQDARTWAEWGFDYIKYDWCAYSEVSPVKNGQMAALPENREEVMKPYKVMRAALDKCERDIIYSLCQYGWGSVWEWGESVGGNSWRTTGDITDTWDSLSRIGFSQAGKEQHAKPGAFNDPDMLIVGWVGWGPNLHPTRLTPNEQYTHISLWCLLASPLLIGCDMTRFDEFTLNLLTNDEVIEVNQDQLGKQAARIVQSGDFEVWMKEMSDGSKAVGIFNRGELPGTYTVEWPDLGLHGKQVVRDLWRQSDLGEFDNQFQANVPRHGAMLIRVRAAGE